MQSKKGTVKAKLGNMTCKAAVLPPTSQAFATPDAYALQMLHACVGDLQTSRHLYPRITYLLSMSTPLDKWNNDRACHSRAFSTGHAYLPPLHLKIYRAETVASGASRGAYPDPLSSRSSSSRDKRRGAAYHGNGNVSSRRGPAPSRSRRAAWRAQTEDQQLRRALKPGRARAPF